MARAKDATTQVGGGVSPYVQTSLQRGKQQAGSRLVAAIQEKGATERTAMQERGAGERAELQARTQREGIAARQESDDKRAAEAEVARREDRQFSQTMAEAGQEFQARQAQLDRDQQKAIIAGDRKAKDEIEKRREALRRFNIELSMDAGERNTNAMLSIIKGSLKQETSMEKAKTVLEEEATQFDKDKDVYTKTKERVTEAVEFDKRMDLPVMGEPVTKAIPAGAPGGFTAGFTRVTTGEIKPGTQADPMGVLQDQIDKYSGNISIEDLAPGKISNVETRIQEGDIRTEDINKTIASIEGMLVSVKERRKSAEKDSPDYDFWHDAFLEIDQMRDNLEGLVSSKKKIVGSETETVGARVQYALGTVHDSSLGGRAARMRDLVGGNFQNVFEEMTKSVQVPKRYDITEDMNKYDVEYRTWMNDYLGSRYPEIEGVE